VIGVDRLAVDLRDDVAVHLDEDLLDDSDQRIASHWRLLGYRDVNVTHKRDAQGDALIITFHVDRGLRYRIENVEISGNGHVDSLKIRETLGIKPGETTTDGKFTISLVECLGSCGTAPMFQIGFEYHENLTPEKVDQILDSLT